jgi:hypothetical protein
MEERSGGRVHRAVSHDEEYDYIAPRRVNDQQLRPRDAVFTRLSRTEFRARAHLYRNNATTGLSDFAPG